MNTPDNEDSFYDETPIVMQTSTVAYVRPVMTEKGINYAVCAADGTQLAVFATRDGAYFAAKQQDLDPVLIH